MKNYEQNDGQIDMMYGFGSDSDEEDEEDEYVQVISVYEGKWGDWGDMMHPQNPDYYACGAKVRW